MIRSSQTRAYVMLSLIVTLWGSYPAFAKLALVDFPPFLLVFFRVSLASAYLTFRYIRRAEPDIGPMTLEGLRSFAWLGLSGIFVSTAFTYLAIYLTTASNAVILQASTPVMVAVGAWLYLKERLGVTQWLGVACSAVGALFVITKGRLTSLRIGELNSGDFVILFTLVGWAVYTIYGKRVLVIYSPAIATTMAYLFGTLMLLPLTLATLPLFPSPRLGSPVAWSVVLYQAILGGIAHVWWYEGVKTVGASRAAIFMNLQPVVGVLLAAVMLGDTIGIAQVLGGLAILLGVALTTQAWRREPRSHERTPT